MLRLSFPVMPLSCRALVYERLPMAELTSRERVLRAIDHQESDRLPRGFSASPAISGALQRIWGLDDAEALRQRLKVDLQVVSMGYNNPYTDGRSIYGWGAVGATSFTSYHPLANATSVADVEAHQWPDPDWADIDAFRRDVIAARRTGRAVVASSWGSIFGEAYRLMGMDNFMASLVLYPEVVAAIIQHLTDFFLEVDRRAFTVCRGLIDISFHGNDFGTQRGLLFRRPMWQQFFAKPIKELLDQCHGFGLRTMYHSCGSVRELIPDLIASGVDVLDPVQATAAGMDPMELKTCFGNQIAFHGGISVQKTLALSTPEEVRIHVKEVCSIMRPGGGYIFDSDQSITEDTPIENVVAMYDTIEAEAY